MKNQLRTLVFGILYAVTMMTAGCVVAEPREGYWDHEHNRWYHEHKWHDCHEPDAVCR
jgi:hypothetical protein